MSSPLQLDFSKFSVRLEKRADVDYIFDPVRGKWVVLTPEEEVRQWLIQYLVVDKQFPLKCIGIERQLYYNQKPKRFDMLVFDRKGQALMLIELKRPDVDIGSATLEQIAQYNHVLKVPYLCIFNGRDLYICRKDSAAATYQFLSEIPDYSRLLN